MTLRPAVGVAPRQPPRSAHPSSSSQRRPKNQRPLPQQRKSSPASRLSRQERGLDAVGDNPGAAHDRFRHGTNLKRASSGLRNELFNESDSQDYAATGPAPPTELSPTTLASEPELPKAESPVLLQTSVTADDNEPLPLPKRPRKPSVAPTSPYLRPATPALSPVKKDGRPRPWIGQVPTAAPRLPPLKKSDASNKEPFNKGIYSGFCDYMPWSGIHHEDEWTIEAIQKGTWDRGSLNDSHSARLGILPRMRHKPALNALGSIFLGVLSQRRKFGQVTASSTFKPPPRVTLTDTKREMWLRDLANPAISLRRLSRTIPHGIRGRTLLDQCLNKKVSTERAVWLAKCVGANEIRAFKRKGPTGSLAVGGEVKWIRDWTAIVEQFVEAVVAAFDEADWKARVTYALRFATHLYSEQLLDRDHYLDWVMCGVENSVQARLSMWILIAQITWSDLLGARKYGRRLIHALLAHLHKIQVDPDRDVLMPLSNQLMGLLRSLVAKHAESFVDPAMWSRYVDVLRSLPGQDASLQAALHQLHRRNARFSVANRASPVGRQYMVKLLDVTLRGGLDRFLAARCWSAMGNDGQAVRVLMEWAISAYRPSPVKAHVAVSLLKAWNPFGIDVTAAVLALLDDMPAPDPARDGLLCKLVAELVRCNLFSASRYVYWLIERGGLRDNDLLDPASAPCHLRLLVELPRPYLSESQATQRNNLLRRAGQYSITEEAQDIATAVRCVDAAIGLLPFLDANNASPPAKVLSLRQLLRRISCSNLAVQSSVAAHLDGLLTAQLVRKAGPAAALSIFTSARAVLEAIGDHLVLSHMVKVFSMTGNSELLAACADTVSMHVHVFLVLGRADELFSLLLYRLKQVARDPRHTTRPFLATLSGLARRLPSRADIAKQLAHESALSDRNQAIDVCSPVSDNTASQAPGADGDFSEQVEKLLASGNSVDQPTMNRLFRTIIPKLESGWMKADRTRGDLASLLARLRTYDAQHFDKLMSDWICHVRMMPKRPALSELFPVLVVSHCATFPTMMRLANTAAPKAGEASQQQKSDYVWGSAVYAQELLQLILSTATRSLPLQPADLYRFRMAQAAVLVEHREALLLLIRRAFIGFAALTANDTNDAPRPLLDETVEKKFFLDALKTLLVTDSTAAISLLDLANLPSGAFPLVHRLATMLLPTHDGTSEISFDQVLASVNELNMPFCQLKLYVDLYTSPDGATDSGGVRKAKRLAAFAKAMDHAIEARNIAWTGMLPILSKDITRNLSAQAHARLLQLMPSLKAKTVASDATSLHRVHLAGNLLGVIEAIIAGQPLPPACQLAPPVVDRLCDLWEMLRGRDPALAPARDAVLQHWLPTLLKLITLQSASSAAPANPLPPPPAHDTKARAVHALCGLLAIEAQTPVAARPAATQGLFDTALLLVDTLPDDARLRCAKRILHMPGRAATAHTSDCRLYYLFSVPPPCAADNLRLARFERVPARWGRRRVVQARSVPFALRRWELLKEPTPLVGENDTSLSLRLFHAIKT